MTNKNEEIRTKIITATTLLVAGLPRSFGKDTVIWEKTADTLGIERYWLIDYNGYGFKLESKFGEGLWSWAFAVTVDFFTTYSYGKEPFKIIVKAPSFQASPIEAVAFVNLYQQAANQAARAQVILENLYGYLSRQNEAQVHEVMGELYKESLEKTRQIVAYVQKSSYEY